MNAIGIRSSTANPRPESIPKVNRFMFCSLLRYYGVTVTTACTSAGRRFLVNLLSALFPIGLDKECEIGDLEARQKTNHTPEIVAIQILRAPIRRAELQHVADESFGDLVKAVVDIARNVIAIGGELHADEEAVLLQDGNRTCGASICTPRSAVKP